MFYKETQLPNPYYAPYPGSRDFTYNTPVYNKKAFDYWGSIDDAFSEGYKDNNALYVNASSDNTSKADDRYNEGIEAGLNLINQLESSNIVLKKGETIKIVGHSQGGAFAAGMANVISKNKKYSSILQEVVYLEPHQPGDFNHPNGVKGVQVSSAQDRVASKWNFLSGLKGKTSFTNIKGINQFIDNDTYEGDMLKGYSVGSNLDEIIRYFESKGVKVNVYK